jgi:hypothetical protein
MRLSLAPGEVWPARISRESFGLGESLMPRPRDARTVSPIAAIRRGWLDEVIHACQQMAGQSILADREEARALLQSFADSLRPSSTPIEAMLLRSVLLDTAYRCGHALHERLHRERRAVCPFNPATHLICFWNAGGDSAVTAFHRLAMRQQISRTREVYARS